MSAERTYAERHAAPQVSANGRAPARPGADDRDGGRPGRPGGLAWEAQFAPRDGDVFDTVEWDYRDVLIRAMDGSTVFRQDRVHAPASWSDQAVQVVASKYFHGDPAKGNDPATGGRESSVKQLIYRVCSTAQAWGLADGYFASPGDAERFGRDLTWLCLHQHAAFNSPVWFNLGLGQVYGLKGDADNFRWDRESQSAVPCEDSYINGQCSACQPYHATVNTVRGLIPIGRIVHDNMVGLRVYDGNGTTTNVVAVKANGRKPVYRVTLNDGFRVEATGDHRVCAHRVSNEKTLRWLAVDELTPGMMLRVYPSGQSVSLGLEPADDIAVSEAALAGWLQTDGFVGQYDGTNKSLTIEFETVNAQELAWVDRHVGVVFPGAHRHNTKAEVENPLLDYTRVRLYGEHLRPFVMKYGLLARNPNMVVPSAIAAGDDEVVVAYLRSVFQADGFVSVRTANPDDGPNSAKVGMSKCSEELMRGIQRLLARVGVYSRLNRKPERRADRHDQWEVSIAILSEREKFAAKVGFLGHDKQAKLQDSLDIDGKSCPPVRYQTVVSVEPIGDMEVFDIQTESGQYLSGSVLVHNCFIQPVEDSIEGIMALAASEARLFKGGSGTGTDLSTLRSSREQVKGGGKASGPVSFMRVWDSVAGTIKSGGRSRRAAKIQTLRVDHPDIREFIVCKRDEDRKARALIASGAGKPGMTGAYDEAYSSVMFQNSNVSVRLLDAFLEAAESPGTPWQTKPVLTSTTDTMPSYDASHLLDLMAECTWECGDTGYQFHDTINSWNTTPNSGEIKSSNPCSEYNHIDNSACNLASLNLMKFRSHDGSFDVPRFKAAVRTLVVAQDIFLDRASYPTAAIAETVHWFRQLGLNHSNLGALLMTMGLPYDSDDGRTVAGAVTAIMHGAALEASAELAEVLGPFDEYGPNRVPMQGVVRRHHLAAVNLFASVKERGEPFYGLAYQGVRAMEAAAKRGSDRGFRNAQSTLEVPNGTTGFMMDCDTFGVEPELGLVKYKNLAGGGMMKIINRAVEGALIRLGYSDRQGSGSPGVYRRYLNPPTPTSQVDEILDYIQDHGKVEGAPHLKPEHLPIFDCSSEPPGGGRSIVPSGHVKMLAAVQPFLSGASSKTVNLPASATPAEIRKVVLDAWKLGVKALAVYRDGSKGAQPLSTGTKAGAGGTPAQSPAEVTGARPEAPASVPARPVPQRRRLPDTRDSLTHKFCVAGHEGYLTVGLYPDGSPGEVFLRMAKEGSTVGGLMDAVATSVSLGLQYGVPLDVYAHKFAHGRYEPSGPTHNPELPFASSLTDYVFRWLASQFPLGGKSALRANSEDIDVATWGKIFTPAVPVGVEVSNGPAAGLSSMTSGDTPACPDCGTLTVRRGTCCHCPNCSWTGGCGG